MPNCTLATGFGNRFSEKEFSFTRGRDRDKVKGLFDCVESLGIPLVQVRDQIRFSGQVSVSHFPVLVSFCINLLMKCILYPLKEVREHRWRLRVSHQRAR